MRVAKVWLSSCVICGASIENRGSMRARNACSTACRNERKRRCASAHYHKKRRQRPPRIRLPRIKLDATFRRTRDQAIVDEEKLRRGSCVSCGTTVTPEDLIIFDFDHRDRSDKTDNVSRLKGRHTDSSRLVEEMAKCDLLCCLCHRRKTFEERDFVPTDRLVLTHPTLFDN